VREIDVESGARLAGYTQLEAGKEPPGRRVIAVPIDHTHPRTTQRHRRVCNVRDPLPTLSTLSRGKSS